MYKKLIFAMLMAVTLPAMAQIDDDEDILEDEVPFGLMEAEESEEDSYFESNFLTPLDDDVELEDKNPFFSDEYYAERLKAIPAPEEFHVFNSTVKSYIDRYATRLRRSVSVMLGKYNLYGNIFDDILTTGDFFRDDVFYAGQDGVFLSGLRIGPGAKAWLCFNRNRFFARIQLRKLLICLDDGLQENLFLSGVGRPDLV